MLHITIARALGKIHGAHTAAAERPHDGPGADMRSAGQVLLCRIFVGEAGGNIASSTIEHAAVLRGEQRMHLGGQNVVVAAATRDGLRPFGFG